VLRRQGFNVLDEVVLQSNLQAGGRAGVFGAASEPATALLEVSLDDGEEAVVLTEQNGLLRWHVPAEVPGLADAARPTVSTARFVIPLADDGSARQRAGIPMLGPMLSGLRAFVLKFVAGKIVDFAMDKLEAKDGLGTVIIKDAKSDEADPRKWKPAEKPRPVSVPPTGEKAPEVLLFVHGTFSNTRGSFGNLSVRGNKTGREFLKAMRKRYDVVLGYDHRTLADTPRQNAEELFTMLQGVQWPRPPQIDAIVYSRGALVYRSMIEELLPGSGFKASFRKTVFVGSTNAGTLLAEPENWNDLLDLYTNLALAGTVVGGMVTGGSSVVAREVIKTVGALVKHIVAVAVEDRMVPGLADMCPNSKYIEAIQKPSKPTEQVKDLKYSFVTSDFEPGVNPGKLSSGAAQWLADAVVDRLMDKVSNDLVVHTAAMDRIDPETPHPVPEGKRLSYLRSDGVHHLVYFAQERTAGLLGAVLDLEGEWDFGNLTFRAAAGKKAQLPVQLEALPDSIDLRDWLYRPTLDPLPDVLVNIDRVPSVQDQGREGACTGFALAAMVDYLCGSRGAAKERQVSPYMLYELARKYDEWPGENYEGSSARGAMKGWVAHGACGKDLWPRLGGRLTSEVSDDAALSPGGAYYRVMHRKIRDMHAALAETGILFATVMVHEGWAAPAAARKIRYACPRELGAPRLKARGFRRRGDYVEGELAVIVRKGRAGSGHAVAIVGYTQDGFVVQNSWGQDWGTSGFALLPYDDYLMHSMDVWVAQLGVPVSVGESAEDAAAGGDTVAGLFRATEQIPLAKIRPHVINVGNNGYLSKSGRYWTTEDDLRDLFFKSIPEETAGWRKKRVLIYLHGGLNDERGVARRIVAYSDTLLKNEIYPLHVMWETGAGETVAQIVQDMFTRQDERAGSFRDWMGNFRDHLTDARNRALEFTLAKPGQALWREMKENARLASVASDGAMSLAARHVAARRASVPGSEQSKWEIHVVGHSAGSIFAAYLVPLLCGLGLPPESIQFFAPAITLDLFKSQLLPLMQRRVCPVPILYVLGDEAERKDTVAKVYKSSLLYLVSNAFEDRRGMPLLGMKKFVGTWPPAQQTPAEETGGPALIVANSTRAESGEVLSSSTTHGGFDNDEQTMNEMLCRILKLESGATPRHPFDERTLDFE